MIAHLAEREQYAREERGIYLNVNKFYSDFELLLNSSDQIIDKAAVSRSSDKEIIIALLFSKIINGSKAIKLLCDNHLSIEAEIIIRCNLETLFYLGAILNNIEFQNKFRVKHVFIKRDQIRFALKNQDYFKSFEETLAVFENGLEEASSFIKEKNLKPLLVKDAAIECGLFTLFLEYKMTSDAIHNDPRFLRENMTQYHEDGVFQLDIGPNDSRLPDVLQTSNIVLTYSNLWYRSLFDLDCSKELQDVMLKYEL